VSPLRVGLASDVPTHPFSPLFGELVARLPGFEMSLQDATGARLCDALLHGTLDAAVVTGDAALPDRLNRWPLFSDAAALVMPLGHALDTGDAVPLAHGHSHQRSSASARHRPPPRPADQQPDVPGSDPGTVRPLPPDRSRLTRLRPLGRSAKHRVQRHLRQPVGARRRPDRRAGAAVVYPLHAGLRRPGRLGQGCVKPELTVECSSGRRGTVVCLERFGFECKEAKHGRYG